MKIVVTASGPTLDADVGPRFARSAYYLFVDAESGEFESLENTGGAESGAGIKAAQLLASKNAGVVLTGNCDPNEFRTLAAADFLSLAVKFQVGLDFPGSRLEEAAPFEFVRQLLTLREPVLQKQGCRQTDFGLGQGRVKFQCLPIERLGALWIYLHHAVGFRDALLGLGR
jgi:predicted Fe-Mo cluster-binding NifX family protein